MEHVDNLSRALVANSVVDSIHGHLEGVVEIGLEQVSFLLQLCMQVLVIRCLSVKLGGRAIVRDILGER